MKPSVKKILFILCLFLVNAFSSYSQDKNPLINSGEVIKAAIKLYDDDKYKEAIQEYLKISRNDTNYAWATYELSLTYYRNGDSIKAIEKAKEGLTLHSNHDMMLYSQLGDSYDEAEQFQNAIDTYKEGSKVFPHYHLYYFDMGVAYARQHNDTAAARCFQQALRMNPLHAGSHLQLGYCALRNNKLIPAMLSLSTFLLIENTTKRSMNALVTLEKIGKADVEVNLDSVVDITKGNDHFEALEEMIRSKVALDVKYKSMVKLDYNNLIKPLQAVIEKLIYDAGDEGFWMQTYVPFYTELWKQKYFEGFIYSIFASLDSKDVQSVIKSNKSKIDKMVDFASDYWVKKRANKKILFDGKEQVVKHWYYNNGVLEAIGNQDEAKKKNTGHFQFYHESGRLKSEGNFNQNGEKEGEWKYYYAEGGLDQIAHYKNGEFQDYENYHQNGQMVEKGQLKAGKLNGMVTTYYATGAMQSQINYLNGEKEGAAKVYHTNGKLMRDFIYKAGKADGKYKEYFNNGNLSFETVVINGKQTGVYKRYYRDGQVERQGNMANDLEDGEWKYYYRTGAISNTGTFKAGKKVGIWKEFYDNGQLESEDPYSNGDLAGTFKMYDEDGVLIVDGEYSKGLIKKYTCYDKDKKVVKQETDKGNSINFTSYFSDGKTKNREGKLVNGNKSGTWTFYYHTGKKKQESNFKDGVQDGDEINYYTNGLVHDKVNYTKGKIDGYYISYYKNGKVEKEGWYKDDQRQQQWIYYFPTGVVSEKEYYLDDDQVGYDEIYTIDGKLDIEDYFKYGYVYHSTGFDSTGKVVYRDTINKGNGNLLTHFSNGKTRIDIKMKNGSRDGSAKYYFANGKLKNETTYIDGRSNGVTTEYYPNGNKSHVGYYKDGQLDSAYNAYDENNKLTFTGIYKYGDLNGQGNYYHENGKLMREGLFKDDERDGYLTYYSDDGTPQMRIKYQNGMMMAYTYPGKDGKFVPDIPIVNETANVVAYYVNGNKSAEFGITDGYFEGKYVLYYPNGKVWIEEYNKNGNNEGKKKEYYANGQLKKDENYFYDELDGEAIYYTDKGVKKRKTTYTFGRKNGPEIIYDEVTGKQKKKIIYIDGQPFE